MNKKIKNLMVINYTKKENNQIYKMITIRKMKILKLYKKYK